MQWLRQLHVIALLLVLAVPAKAEPLQETATDTVQEKPPEKVNKDLNFTGQWKTNYGVISLEQVGGHVSGDYRQGGKRCFIDGLVEDRKLRFTYREPDARGEGEFDLTPDGLAFKGRWRKRGTVLWLAWNGYRTNRQSASFDGLWETTFGRLRLNRQRKQVSGVYSYGGGSTVRGSIDKNGRLTFRYREPSVEGEGWFELGQGGESFRGQWRPGKTQPWQEWVGKRVWPATDKQWLVILEARWEDSLAEQEYAFGDMLRTFFARMPNVRIRHRFFSDEPSFRRWCRELAFVEEPVTLVIASHGTAKGLTVDGRLITADAIGESLRLAHNLQLVHFSSCDILSSDAASLISAKSKAQRPFPISGYATSVDWAASAVIEFTYLDLILGRGLSPTAAAKQVRALLPFSGDHTVKGGEAVPPAHFRIVEPTRSAGKSGS